MWTARSRIRSPLPVRTSWHLEPPPGGETLLGIPPGRLPGEAFLPHLDRRGLRRTGADPSGRHQAAFYHHSFLVGASPGLRGGVLLRRYPVPAPQSVFGFESLVRPFRTGFSRYLRHADGGYQLFEQLRAVPVSRKTHPALHQQHPPRKAAARLWER